MVERSTCEDAWSLSLCVMPGSFSTSKNKQNLLLLLCRLLCTHKGAKCEEVRVG